MWTGISHLLDREQPVDVVTLAEHLEKAGTLTDAGGLPYVGSVVRSAGAASNVRAYAQSVRDLATKRALISAGVAQIDAVHNPDGREASDLLSEAQVRLAELAERGVLGSGWVTAKQATHRAIVRLEELFASGGGMVGVSTGWADLDRMTRGLEVGSLVIVAARPSMGKTTAAVQLAQHVATTAPYPAAIFSLEMGADALAMRMLSSLGRIDHDRLRSAKLDEDELHRLTPASATLANLNLHIDDQAGLTIQDITARAKRLYRQQGGLSLVVIDYLGLIAMQGKVENQNLGIGKITAALKGLAKTLKVPVVLLSQLNRDLEKRPNKRPIMSDLRDSGSIEQDADLIVFIYRDEVYNENSRDQGMAELIIAKQRNGPIGTVRLAWLGKYCRFDNLAPEWERPAESMPRHNQNYEY
jgi:replicative DNA helicase